MSIIIDDSTPIETETALDTAEMIKQICILLALEYDLISAYEAVIERIETKAFLPSLEQCVVVHHDHIAQLEKLMIELGGKNNATGDFKEYLAKGYIAVSALFGDYRLLNAMQHNLQLAMHYYSEATKKIFSGNIQLVLKLQLGQTRRHVVQFETWLETFDKDD